MFDVKWIRENPESFDAGLGRRGITPKATALVELDRRRRVLVTDTQKLQGQRNQASKQIGAAKRDGESAEQLVKQVVALKAQLRECDREIRDIEHDIEKFLLQLPNLPEEEVPDGIDETSNVEVRRVGEPGVYDFTAKQHFELGEALGQMDFDAAVRMAGARFVILSGELARLERALAGFMLDIHTERHGYQEISPPYMVRGAALTGTGTASLTIYSDWRNRPYIIINGTDITDHGRDAQFKVAKSQVKELITSTGFTRNFYPRNFNKVSVSLNWKNLPDTSEHTADGRQG